MTALAKGLELFGPDARAVVMTVANTPDPELMTGSGFAGAVVGPEEFEQKAGLAAEEARAVIAASVTALGLEGADTYIVGGDAGEAICQLASEVSAQAIVIGTRGRGGLRRAVLGSVSDHVVRNAPCTVVVTGAG
jgi:nucleotide-binding universal stress UspA family protein